MPPPSDTFFPRPPGAPSGDTSTPPCVWVVDDSASEARFITSALGTGFKVETFPDGAGMLERLHAGRAPDVVVLDWEMPGMSGLEVCQFLRGEPETQALPVLLLTAHGRPEDLVQGLRAGANDYVAKPFRTEEVRARVNALVRTKRLMDDVRRADREKAEVFAQLEALLTSAPVGMALLDRDLRFMRVNARMARMDGLSVDAYGGRTLAEVLPLRAPRLEPVLRRVLETGEATEELPFTQRRPGVPPDGPGSDLHLMGSYHPVRTARGEVLGVGAVVVDVTRHMQAEGELRASAEFRERFLGIVGHDLRNPLNAIRMAASFLLASEQMPAALVRTASRIITSTDRMTRMITELLDFTRSRLGGGIPLTPGATDLGQVARQVVEELELAHPNRTVKVTAMGPLAGRWDADRLAQVLSNLLGNALQYSPAESTVELTLRGEAERVVAWVSNPGEPIAPEDLALLFHPFQRAHTGAHVPSGLGLGLFISEQIIRGHRGTLDVASDAKRTVFTLTLPRGGA
ncbi:response regulator [Corallococcus silvisoli]|uniref:response regulator n=1 Tax=Corallococcus silvisoli TaxID=2697031 RepID=UPI0013777ED0|nr:response regulator [Corallococcus silvisoli]NBD09966.1 response regulator [Corallococcus silvisoli]